MAQKKFNTSFIPKQPAANRLKKKGERKSRIRSHTLNLLSTLSLVLFIASLAGVAGTFLYQVWLERSIEEKKTALAAAEQTFAPDTIEQLKQMDRQFSTADELIDQHTAFSRFFRLLRDHTARDVEFRTFEYTMQDDSAQVQMEGTAQNFNTLVVQKDELDGASTFRDPQISDMQLDTAGNVRFQLQTTVSPKLITYGSELPESRQVDQAQRQEEQQPTVPASATSTTGTSTTTSAGTSTAQRGGDINDTM